MNSSQNDMPNNRASPVPQGVFWICTVKSPHPMFPIDSLPEGFKWLKGQQEVGAGGFEHWQFIAALEGRGRLRKLTDTFGTGHHYELTKSKAAEAYVWKEQTRVAGII